MDREKYRSQLKKRFKELPNGQNSASEALGKPKSSISRWMAEGQGLPNAYELLEIAEHSGVSAAWLAYGHGHKDSTISSLINSIIQLPARPFKRLISLVAAFHFESKWASEFATNRALYSFIKVKSAYEETLACALKAFEDATGVTNHGTDVCSHFCIESNGELFDRLRQIEPIRIKIIGLWEYDEEDTLSNVKTNVTGMIKKFLPLLLSDNPKFKTGELISTEEALDLLKEIEPKPASSASSEHASKQNRLGSIQCEPEEARAFLKWLLHEVKTMPAENPVAKAALQIATVLAHETAPPSQEENQGRSPKGEDVDGKDAAISKAAVQRPGRRKRPSSD